MIAKTRAPLAVKDLSLRYAFVRSPVLQSAPESSRALLIPPPGAARLFSCPSSTAWSGVARTSALRSSKKFAP
jgi:hypothetical protein